MLGSSSIRQALRAMPVAGPSRSRQLVTRSAHFDRYTTIHAFFTRQALSPTPTFTRSQRRWNSTNKPQEGCENCSERRIPPTHTHTKPPPNKSVRKDHAQDYTPFIRRLIASSNAIQSGSPHRPSKEELLAAASGWWQRLRIRIKWFTIRGWRRFNTDDFSAFASWFVLGNTLWILIGTTTFVSAVFATLNSLSLQEYVARWISDYLTSETGVTVIFESAIVPKWKASTITFRNVYVSRRPVDTTTGKEDRPRTHKATPPSPTPFLTSAMSPDTYLAAPPAAEGDNYTMYDINIDEVDVTLSLWRWLDGKGLIKDASVKGVRGVIDRRSVWWDTSKPLRPEDFRHATRPGDFELDSLHIEDALMTIYQPGGQRPYNLSIFNAVIGPFRKRWMFYDLMSAESITGQMDNCLFSLHMPQKLGKIIGDEGGLVKRMARFRIDGLPIEHAQYGTGHTGPISWITSGRLDAVLDIKFPYHPDEQVDLRTIFDQIGRNVATITNSGVLDSNDIYENLNAREGPKGVIPGNSRLARPPLRAPQAPPRELSDDEKETKREVTVDIDLRFRDLKAAVPMFTSDLSMTNNAIIRPVVAFINANRTLIPIHCSVAADLSDFDGSWTLFETGLMTSVSSQIQDALTHHVQSESANVKRIRQVSFWGIQRGAEVLLDTLRNVVDPVHAQLAPNTNS